MTKESDTSDTTEVDKVLESSEECRDSFKIVKYPLKIGVH